MNKILNKNLLNYFIFDGEKIEELIKFEEKDFEKLLISLFGLDIYFQTIKDIEVLKKRTVKENINEKDLKKIKFLENEIEKLNIENENILEEINILKNDIFKLKKEEKSFIKKTTEYSKFNDKLNEIKISFNELLNEFYSYLYIKLPFLLNKNLTEKIKKRLNNYNEIDLNLIKKKENLIKKLTKIDNEILNLISQSFDEVFNLNKEITNSDKIDNIETLKNIIKYYNEDKKDFLNLLNKLEKKLFEINKIEKYLKENKNEKEIFKTFLDIQQKIVNKNEEIIKLKNKFDNNIKNRKNIKKELKLFSKIEFKNNLLNIKLKEYEKTILIFKEFIEENKKREILKLEDIINKNLKIINENKLNVRNTKLKENFKISFYDNDNKEIGPLSLSSGKKI